MKNTDYANESESPSAQELAEEQELQAIYPGYQGVDAGYVHAGKKSLERWQDWKFGMRIHWGVYSILGLDAQDWESRAESEEFKKIYKTLYQVFNPTDFNAEEWAQLAKRAGMKYFVITAKHGDGFCMFNTQRKVKALRRRPRSPRSSAPLAEQCEDVLISYSIMDTPFKRDIFAELISAFRKRGMGIGVYPGTVPFPPNIDVNDPGYDHALELVRQELYELCTNYGKIDIFSFDDGEGYVPRPEVIRIIKMVRKLQPEALFRNRGLGPYGDFQTPEHWVPESGGDDPRVNRPWEAIEQLGLRWAYQPNDTYNSKEWILETLIDCVAKGGNFMVGISPMANGKFPEKTVERLLWVGAWLKVNGEAIYATRPYKFHMQRDPERGDNVRFTRSKDSKNVYAISLTWPGKTLRLKYVRANEGARVYMLGAKEPLNWRNDPTEGLVIEIPDFLQDEVNRPCEHAYAFKIEGAVPVEVT